MILQAKKKIVGMSILKLTIKSVISAENNLVFGGVNHDRALSKMTTIRKPIREISAGVWMM